MSNNEENEMPTWKQVEAQTPEEKKLLQEESQWIAPAKLFVTDKDGNERQVGIVPKDIAYHLRRKAKFAKEGDSTREKISVAQQRDDFNSIGSVVFGFFDKDGKPFKDEDDILAVANREEPVFVLGMTPQPVEIIMKITGIDEETGAITGGEIVAVDEETGKESAVKGLFPPELGPVIVAGNDEG